MVGMNADDRDDHDSQPANPETTVDIAAITARFARRAARFDTVLAAVPDEAWGNQSPCADWTAAGVVGHVVESEWDFLDRFFPGPERLDASADPVAAWEQSRDRVLEVLADPERAGLGFDGFFGPTTVAEVIDTFYSTDLVLHGWDVARAAGLTELEPIDSDELDAVQATMAPLGDNVRMPGVFGPAVPVADDADHQTRVLAWSGRQP